MPISSEGGEKVIKSEVIPRFDTAKYNLVVWKYFERKISEEGRRKLEFGKGSQKSTMLKWRELELWGSLREVLNREEDRSFSKAE